MATVYYPTLEGSRIANATRVWQAVEDAGKTGWDKTADFILATALATSKGPLAYAYKLQWRNKTDGGSFADVGSTGEITFSAATDLVDGDDLLTGEAGCTGAGTWQNGLESEGDNISPDSGTYSLADEYWTEFQWALDCSNALDNKEYEFQLLTTGDNIIGVCLVTLTIAAGVTPKSVSDVLSLADAISLKNYLTIPDTLSLADAISWEGIVSLADTLSLADALSIKANLLVTDTLSLADTIAVKLFKTIIDTLSLADAISAKIKISISDTLSLADATPSITVSFTLTDTLSVTDIVAIGQFKTVVDSLSLADAVALKISFTLTDTLSIADAITVVKAIKKTVSDALALADQAPSVAVSFTITDSLSLTEIPTVKGYISILDILGLSDVVSPKALVTITDSLGLSETLAISAALTISDTLTLTEAISAKLGLTITDSLTLAEAITMVIKITVSDEIYLSCMDNTTPVLVKITPAEYQTLLNSGGTKGFTL